MNENPKRINPFTLAKQAVELKGSLDLAEMSELLPLLNRLEGVVDYELRFSQEGGRKTVVHGSIRAEVPLLCQRCAEEFRYPLVTEIYLQAVINDEQAAKLSPPYEPLLVDEERCVELVKLIEEEIILALPMLPKHTDDRCVDKEFH